MRTPYFLLLPLFSACASTVALAQPVSAGSDVIDRALVRLVPAPYQATIDAKVPADTVLIWNASSDWMRALHEATAAAGLRVQPSFEVGRVDVLPGQEPPKQASPSVPAPAVQAAADRVAVPMMGNAPGTTTQPQGALQPPATASPAPAAPPATSTFVLSPGLRIDAQFGEWSKRDGWSLLWTSDKSWILPGTSSVTYAGPVDVAIESAVKDLYGNGVPVRLDIWEANKVMEISHAK